MDAAQIDLKGFNEHFYDELCDGELAPVLETLKRLKALGVWFEIVTLVIPTLNDDMDDIRRMCRWVRDVLSDQVPIHFNRFFPQFLGDAI